MPDPLPSPKNSFGGWFRDRFIAGLFVVVPIALVFWLIQLLYNLLNGPADSVIRFLISHHWLPDSQYFIDNTAGTVPGAGFTITLLLVVGVGVTVSHMVGRKFIQMIDRLFTSVPLVKTVYLSMQQIVQAVQQFSDKSKGQQFSQVVLVQMAGDGIYCMGFLTSQFTDPKGVVYGTVFVPTPPSPVNGLLFLVPVEKLIPADFISVEQATKMVMSMGLVSPEIVKATPLGQALRPG